MSSLNSGSESIFCSMMVLRAAARLRLLFEQLSGPVAAEVHSDLLEKWLGQSLLPTSLELAFAGRAHPDGESPESEVAAASALRCSTGRLVLIGWTPEARVGAGGSLSRPLPTSGSAQA